MVVFDAKYTCLLVIRRCAALTLSDTAQKHFYAATEQNNSLFTLHFVSESHNYCMQRIAEKSKGKQNDDGVVVAVALVR